MITQLYAPRALVLGTAAGTSVGYNRFDLNLAQNIGDYLVIEILVTTRSVSPGAAKTATLFYAFSSEQEATPAELLTAAAFTDPPYALVDAANARRYYMTLLLYQGARYLHTWFNNDVLTTAVDVAISINTKR